MKIANGTLVMALDGGKMLLMRNTGDVPRPVLDIIAEGAAANPRSGLQGSDRPGRSFSSSDARRSALGETDWHEQGERRFASDAVDTLAEAQARYDAPVILLAAPSVLGVFRKDCPKQLGARIVAEIDKDVVNMPVDDIAAIIAAHEP